MSKRLYKHLTMNNLLYEKQFGFQEKHLTKHAVIQLIYQINDSFEKNHFNIGIFIELLKAFDTVDQKL